MTRIIACFYALVLYLCLVGTAQSQTSDATLDDPSIFSSVDLKHELRLRYNVVDDEGFSNNANNLTLRLATALTASPLPKTHILIEGEGVLAIVDDFNDGSPVESDLPFIPDADGIELNRAQILTEIVPNTRLTLGRQRIVYDDGRFIGDSVFRQNNQTFDAVRGRVNFFETGYLDAAYIGRTLRAFGGNSDVGRFVGDSYTINANVQTPFGRLSAFHYALDLATEGNIGKGGTLEPSSAASNRTSGVMLRGRRLWDNKGLEWELGYANQSDFADNPLDYNADYFVGLIGGTFGGFKLKAKYESLGGSEVKGFQTPIASLRGFNGFSDVFLAIPDDGLEDISLQASYNFGDLGVLKNTRFLARGHVFSAEQGGENFGTEFDASLSFDLATVTAQLDIALFESDGFASDSQRLFVTLSRKF